jgi:hypothetical protein
LVARGVADRVSGVRTFFGSLRVEGQCEGRFPCLK